MHMRVHRRISNCSSALECEGMIASSLDLALRAPDSIGVHQTHVGTCKLQGRL